ncbi:exported protein of unknown function; Putative Outer membrane protein [Bradyrhizobium sp. ORS 285]|uniref:outer membrane protein n=1 Tax=Bradyrhizobium sp. ORS 285 TaxID=115808 RepID=UPI0002408EF8|nr:outer membrane beta-barrel protein [Bradyrhizobium sp. ORS 285]CCD85120.1 exported hypothetical protein; putative Outer membrane protein [Bradyrhizobium sp. ORS 285]SMX58440.1 exported protein of unknown function; Putative Outer membrane protein [Bradyrhizobium sp. ORS 285]
MMLKGLAMGRRFGVVATLCSLGLISGSAPTFAGEADTSRVLEKLAALEARVASLEIENRNYRRRLAGVQRHSEGLTPAGSERMTTPDRPLKVAAPEHFRAPSSDWTGVFWGVSAGGAATRSSTSLSERNALSSPGFLNGYDTSGVTSPTSGAGGFIDVFAGADVQWSRFVIGGQLEASMSDLNFSSSGTRSLTYFDQNGPTGITASANYRPQVSSRWMSSALVRAGVLLDESTLVYGLGGWTFAQFEARNITDNPLLQPKETFWVNGPTGGIGIERSIGSNWRVRAEYRYTKFEKARTEDQFAFISSPSSQTYSRSTQFDHSMQSGRIGFAYALNPLQ